LLRNVLWLTFFFLKHLFLIIIEKTVSQSAKKQPDNLFRSCDEKYTNFEKIISTKYSHYHLMVYEVKYWQQHP